MSTKQSNKVAEASFLIFSYDAIILDQGMQNIRFV